MWAAGRRVHAPEGFRQRGEIERAFGRQPMAVDVDGPGIGGEKPVHQADQRGLPGSARSQKDGRVPRGNRDTEGVQGDRVSKTLVNLLDLDHGNAANPAMGAERDAAGLD